MHGPATSRFVFSLALALSLVACKRGDKAESGGDVALGPWSAAKITKVKGVDASAVRASIAAITKGPKPKWITARQWDRVKKSYAAYSGGPLWLEKNGVEGRVKSLAMALTASHGDALRLDAYPLAELARTVVALDRNEKPTPDQLAQADVMFNVAYVALSEDLLTGQVDPRTVLQSWNIDPQEERVDSAVLRTLRAEDLKAALASMRPRDADYAFLQKELDRYRELVVKGGWGTVPAGKPVKPGQRDSQARLTALRARLRVEGYLAGDSSSGPVYDRNLAGVVAQWQSMHGIGVDSMLGAETIEALNKPAGYRLGQIAANLERLRWMPRSLGDRYIIVNAPEFRVEGWRDGRKEIEMKVIVGADFTDRATPVFSDTMTHVVFRPYWNVTDDIANKELWPAIRSNPGYMAANDYETFNDGGTTRIRQRPGPKNALGLVKFMFPNAFNIYLHDTPNDELFKKDVRALSHGCIRLEKPAELAQWVLGWDAGKVQQAMESGPDDRRVNLPKAIPVYIAYFTTYQRDGKLYFGNDLYDRDDKLVAALAAGGSSGEAIKAAQELRAAVEN